MKLRKIFSDNVRKYRTEQALSQEELAEKTGLHRTYIGSVERGERNITIDVMEKISNGLRIPIIDLLKE
jgi:transcriptional regulator with XRE-family HTH domain